MSLPLLEEVPTTTFLDPSHRTPAIPLPASRWSTRVSSLGHASNFAGAHVLPPSPFLPRALGAGRDPAGADLGPVKWSELSMLSLTGWTTAESVYESTTTASTSQDTYLLHAMAPNAACSWWWVRSLLTRPLLRCLRVRHGSL